MEKAITASNRLSNLERLRESSVSVWLGLTIYAATLICSPALAQTDCSEAADQQAPLSRGEIDRIPVYRNYWQLGGANADMPHEQAVQLATKVARDDFAGRGPALARYFLTHQDANINTFIFLLRAVGDVQTADILIQALPDPPEPVDSVLHRHAGEIVAAVSSLLEEESLRQDPAILASLLEAFAKAQAISWAEHPRELLISLIGRLQTPRAVEALEKLAGDPDPAIRRAAARALGQTGLLAAKPVLEETLSGDRSAEVRREAADSLGYMPDGSAVSTLKSRLDQEQDPRAIDAILKSMLMQEGIPSDPQACFEMAAQGWDAEIITPFFNCWRQAATRPELISQAVSGSWPIRALAMQALTQAHHPKPRRTLIIQKQPTPAPPVLGETVQQKLLQSAVEIYSNNISGSAQPGSISHETARFTREAFWEIADHDMELAISYTDRIKPVWGRYAYIGRYGMSSHLSENAPKAYAAVRRPGQLLGISFFFAVSLLLAVLRRTRALGAGLAAGTVAWMIWLLFQTGIDQFPPPPMWLVSVSGLGFLSGGLAAGSLAMFAARRWVKVITAPLLASFLALLSCGLVFEYEFYPIRSGGWEMFFAPIASALVAFPMALIISIGLLAVSRKHNNRTSRNHRSGGSGR